MCLMVCIAVVYQDHRKHTIEKEKIKFITSGFNSLFASSSVGLAFVDVDGKYIRVNDAFCEMLQYSREELLQLSIADATATIDLPAATENTLSIIEGKVDRFRMEKRYVRKDRSVFWADLTVNALKNENGDLIGLAGVILDISRRKKFEEKLDDSRKMMDSILTTVPDIIYRLDSDGNFVFVSDSIRQYGYSPDDLIGKNVFEIIHPKDKQRATYRINERRTGERRTRDFELRIAHNETDLSAANDSESVVVIEAQGLYTSQESASSFLGTQGIAHDVTERKREQEAFRKTEELNKDILTNTPIGIIYLNKEGIIEFANDIVFKMFNISIENSGKLIGGHYRTIAPVMKKIPKHASFQQVLDGKSISGIEFQINPAEGIKRLIRAIIAPRKDHLGTIIGAIVLCEDITELKDLEAQLLQAQRMEAIGLLAGGIAHDFNNLLTVIALNADLALLKFDGQKPTRRPIEEIRNTANRASELTRQLLTFSRKQMVIPQVLDLNYILTNLEKMLRRIIGEHIDLQTETCTGLWNLKADPSQIEQVIVNLTVNARDAMPEGGSLVISTANVQIDKNSSHLHQRVPSGNYVLLSVADTGAGMTADVKEHLFEPFFTTKQEGKGTGLGLATVFGIVHQCNGHIRVISEPGEGSTFHIYLPKTAGEVSKSQKSLDPEWQTLQGDEQILIVEDEASVLTATSHVLKRFGYTVFQAESGRKALDMLSAMETPVDLVLTDVIMPGMDGVEFSHRMKAIYNNIPVVFMSGYTDNQISDRGVDVNSTPYIHKPFKPLTLVETIRKTLDQTNTMMMQ